MLKILSSSRQTNYIEDDWGIRNYKPLATNQMPWADEYVLYNTKIWLKRSPSYLNAVLNYFNLNLLMVMRVIKWISEIILC